MGSLLRDPLPTVDRDTLSLSHVQSLASSFIVAHSDPFNSLPGHQPINRTRIEVFVIDELTNCPASGR